MTSEHRQPSAAERSVLLVAGAGRSGTSTMVGLLQILGLHVPTPEVPADESNPKGFGESTWVVEHHDRLLREAGVQVSDGRPDAWAATAEVAARDDVRSATAEWLTGHLRAEPELVVKDPRLSYFLTAWRDATVRAEATPLFVTMLRPPAEVVGSRQTYYGSRLGAAHLVASWLNMLLHTEHATRDAVGSRAFVRYADLLGAWQPTIAQVGETLGLSRLSAPDTSAVAAAGAFVDPSLRRMSQTLAELDLPTRLRELTERTWIELDGLASPGGDTPVAHTALDELRAAYVDLYAESEAITRSSVVAAEHRARAAGRKPADAPTDAAPAPTPAYAADRIPHGVRALVPPGLRRGLRAALGRRR